MSPAELDPTETVIRFSRRQLWALLGFMVVLAAVYLSGLLFPGHRVGAGGWIAALAVALGVPSSRIQWGSAATRRALDALRNDELRQYAQTRAFRNGFIVQMVYPIACAFALIGLGVAEPWPFVVGSTAWLGFVTFLASLLWYDR